MNKVLFLLIAMYFPTMSFEIDKDTVNFIDTSPFQHFFLINNADTSISIDTIMVSTATNTAFHTGMEWFFDTSSNHTYNPNSPYAYNVPNWTIQSSPYIAVCNGNKILKISGKDSLKITNAYCWVMTVAKIAKAEMTNTLDTLKFVFKSSNNEKDSIIAIAYSTFADNVINSNYSSKCIKNANNSLKRNLYLVNGRLINNGNLSKTKSSQIIIKSP